MLLFTAIKVGFNHYKHENNAFFDIEKLSIFKFKTQKESKNVKITSNHHHRRSYTCLLIGWLDSRATIFTLTLCIVWSQLGVESPLEHFVETVEKY